MNSYLFLQILVVIIGVAFLTMGIYALYSGRVYGRTWEKYLGGWVYKSKNPAYYWQYTFMYWFVGIVTLIGCSIVSLSIN
ncbi:MAG: hypothetical protein Q7K54_04855 [Candidatus Parcubacteria bacterium]|nr:hypothetical protein [Candidatus Parcubacteria bacterium]